MRLRILADRVIAQAAEAFSGLGEVTLADGRAIDRALVAQCDVLLVRSVTRVDGTLLADSPVRFVGTATAGTDHIDETRLRERGIRFAAAPGCNARPVGEYVLACVLAHAARIGRAPADLSCAVIGCGHAGTAALSLLEGFGLRCLRNDPPRAQREAGFVPLAAALQADVVSLHVPLSATGSQPTLGLIDAAALAAMRPGTLLINAARGGVVDEVAWLREIHAGRLQAAVDCWNGEPEVSPALLAAAFVATPHIAGHSVDARIRATGQLRAALADWCTAQGEPVAQWTPAAEEPLPVMTLPMADPIGAAVSACCDPLAQTAAMRAALADPAARRGAFDRLRAEIGRRREFGVRPVALIKGAPDTADLLDTLGFTLVTA